MFNCTCNVLIRVLNLLHSANTMSDDWDTVTVLRKRAPNKATMKSEAAVNQARRQGGEIATETKCKYLG